MSKNYKKISFLLPDFIVKHLEKYLEMIGYSDLEVSHFIKCLAINRLIEKGILNEFCEPFQITLSGSLDFSNDISSVGDKNE